MEGARAAVTGGDWRALDLPLQGRKALQEAVEARLVPAPEYGDSHFVAAHRSYISLALRSPVDLDTVAPGRHGEMPADAEAAQGAQLSFEPGPAPHLRAQAVRPDDPTGGENTPAGPNSFGRQPLGFHSPAEVDSDLLPPPDEGGVQLGAAHSQSAGAGKVPLGHEVAVDIANTA